MLHSLRGVAYYDVATLWVRPLEVKMEEALQVSTCGQLADLTLIASAI
jgi:hypothetical protein